MQSPRRIEHWRQLYGEEHVNNSITLLKRHVAKCWQPSWYELAGVLTPSDLQGVSHSDPAESRVEEPSDTRPKEADTKPQQPPRQHPVSRASAATMNTSRVSSYARSSTAKDVDGLQPPTTLQSGKLGSGPPAVEMASSVCLTPASSQSVYISRRETSHTSEQLHSADKAVVLPTVCSQWCQRSTSTNHGLCLGAYAIRTHDENNVPDTP